MELCLSCTNPSICSSIACTEINSSFFLHPTIWFFVLFFQVIIFISTRMGLDIFLCLDWWPELIPHMRLRMPHGSPWTQWKVGKGRHSHFKDNMVMKQSYLCNGSPCIDKVTFPLYAEVFWRNIDMHLYLMSFKSHWNNTAYWKLLRKACSYIFYKWQTWLMYIPAHC